MDGLPNVTSVVGSVPVPDPTSLTNDLVKQAIGALREVIEARLDGNDRALDQLAKATDARVFASLGQISDLYIEIIKRVELRIDALGAVSDQRFLRVDAGFLERDKRADQLALANQAALTAALAAQKEAAAEAGKSAALAISKSEAATAEAIKQGQTLFQTGLSSLTNQVTDLKSRLDKGEGSRLVSDPTTEARLNALSNGVANLMAVVERRGGGDDNKKENSTVLMAVIVAVIAAAGVGVSIVVALTHR